VVVVLAVAVAGVIFVGHVGHGDVYDRDHHSQFRLGASIRRGKASLSTAFCDVIALGAGFGRENSREMTRDAEDNPRRP
jgi:hypothetical protein